MHSTAKSLLPLIYSAQVLARARLGLRAGSGLRRDCCRSSHAAVAVARSDLDPGDRFSSSAEKHRTPRTSASEGTVCRGAKGGLTSITAELDMSFSGGRACVFEDLLPALLTDFGRARDSSCWMLCRSLSVNSQLPCTCTYYWLAFLLPATNHSYALCIAMSNAKVHMLGRVD